MYPYAIGYISSNFRRKIDSRYFVGLGLTYQLIKKENHSLKISANTVYEETRFNGNIFNFDTFNGTNVINVWRSSLFLSGSHFLITLLMLKNGQKNVKDYWQKMELYFGLAVAKGLHTHK